MLSSYFIEVHTQQDYPLSEYDAAAGRLSQMVTSILADKTAIAQLTHDAPRDTCHSDLEVGLRRDLDATSDDLDRPRQYRNGQLECCNRQPVTWQAPS